MTTPYGLIFAPESRGWMGDPSRGAAMGQPDRTPEAAAPKLYLRRVRLNSGGYDTFGSYWGGGTPLYQTADENGDILLSLRAWDREDAKAQVRETYPNARFFR